MPGEPAHVQLVDHQVAGREVERLVVLPVEVVAGDLCPVRVTGTGAAPDAPLLRAADQPGIGVQEYPAGVEAVTIVRTAGAVGPVTVLAGLRVQPRSEERRVGKECGAR